jgi:hypothetical protein
MMYLAVMHHPVRGKDGKDCTSSITNIDLHDLARSAKTFGVEALYFVHPQANQLDFAQDLIEHWVSGYGATYNPSRKDAIELIRLKQELGNVVDEISEREGKEPLLVATSAQPSAEDLSYDCFRQKMAKCNQPILLLLGTAWGLSNQLTSQCHVKLAPVLGRVDYNHLSVRSAAAIMLDRLLSQH